MSNNGKCGYCFDDCSAHVSNSSGTGNDEYGMHVYATSGITRRYVSALRSNFDRNGLSGRELQVADNASRQDGMGGPRRSSAAEGGPGIHIC